MRNWADNTYVGTGAIHRPRSLAELRDAVTGSNRVRAIGSRHSFSQVLSTTGDVVLLDALPKMVDVDSQAGTAWVGAGMRLAEIAPPLHRAGYALANMPSLPDLTIGGVCATGTHGSGDARTGLAASVVGLHLVDAHGDVVELSRAGNPDIFAGSVVALGALGVVTALELRVDPTYEIAQTVRVGVGLADVAARFDEVFSAGDSVSVFTGWCGETAVWLKCRVAHDAVEASLASLGVAASRAEHPVPGASADTTTTQLGIPGPWFDRLPHFVPGMCAPVGQELQSEYFLPRSAAAAAIESLRAIADVLAPHLLISEIRTVRADDLWLSEAYQQDSVTFHFTWKHDVVGVQAGIAAVEQQLRPLGARPHWAKLTAMTGPEIAARYPRAVDFRDLRDKLDPIGRFRNDFVDDLLAEAGR